MSNNASANAVSTINACPETTNDYIVYATYPKNTLLYNRNKANQGVLETVIIKDYIVNNSNVIYVDTFNWFWKNGELCTKETAYALALKYDQTLLAELESCEIILGDCC